MSKFMFAEIRGIVFDLDGTLYVCERFAAAIQDAASVYLAGVIGVTQGEATELMAATRKRLAGKSGMVQTISAVCTELGGDVQELHRFFESTLSPEAYVKRDERVIRMMKQLACRLSLYIYTNNNHALTARILKHLGLDDVMNGIYAIDDTWRAKPDESLVTKILETIRLAPHQALFVGDRYDVDLRVPEQLGCPVYLSQSVEQLLRLEELLVPVHR